MVCVTSMKDAPFLYFTKFKTSQQFCVGLCSNFHMINCNKFATKMLSVFLYPLLEQTGIITYN